MSSELREAAKGVIYMSAAIGHVADQDEAMTALRAALACRTRREGRSNG